MRFAKLFVEGRITIEEVLNYHGSGVFFVYRVNRDDLKYRLIYVGVADDIGAFISTRNDIYNQWLQWAYNDTSYLRFSVTHNLSEVSNDVCAAALVTAFAPAVNNSDESLYTQEPVRIEFEGRKVCNRSSIDVSANR